ncbi:MAG: glycosyltransferase family 2 protein [Thaumarchaeota archaeon]|nr:glycosyltransferase family 2 protein [Nitrososphaerota archaeon]
MKLVVLIPAYNEEENIEKVVRSIPRKIIGVDDIKILVVDDGSTDQTMDMAMNGGAYRVVSHKRNAGVGAAFMTGIRNAITMNADILVAVDADSQFDSNQISELILPIINNQADVVIGTRFQNEKPKNIPRIKYLGNKIFTKIVSSIVQQKFTDTQTGFRAYSREALLNISVVNDFTYTQEVLIDLKFKGMQITEVPVSVKYDDKRKSRVVKNIFNYSSRALAIIIRTLVFHRPMFAFNILGGIFCGVGVLAKIVTAFNIISINTSLSTGLIILGGVSFMMGVFASVVFRRQVFAEKDLRHYLESSDSSYFDKIGATHDPKF